jgi:hypothetical protein
LISIVNFYVDPDDQARSSKPAPERPVAATLEKRAIARNGRLAWFCRPHPTGPLFGQHQEIAADQHGHLVGRPVSAFLARIDGLPRERIA